MIVAHSVWWYQTRYFALYYCFNYSNGYHWFSGVTICHMYVVKIPNEASVWLLPMYWLLHDLFLPGDQPQIHHLLASHMPLWHHVHYVDWQRARTGIKHPLQRCCDRMRVICVLHEVGTGYCFVLIGKTSLGYRWIGTNGITKFSV